MCYCIHEETVTVYNVVTNGTCVSSIILWASTGSDDIPGSVPKVSQKPRIPTSSNASYRLTIM